MNTGIGDAINLAWKLKTVLAGGAPDALLDTHEGERIGFAGLEFGQYRKSDRHDSRAQDAGESALSRREREDPIGSLNQTLPLALAARLAN